MVGEDSIALSQHGAHAIGRGRGRCCLICVDAVACTYVLGHPCHYKIPSNHVRSRRGLKQTGEGVLNQSYILHNGAQCCHHTAHVRGKLTVALAQRYDAIHDELNLRRQLPHDGFNGNQR